VLFLAASLTGVVAVWLVGTRLLPFLFRRLTTVDLRRVALGCALVGIAASSAYASPVIDPGYRECRYVERFDRWGNVRTIKVCDVVPY